MTRPNNTCRAAVIRPVAVRVIAPLGVGLLVALSGCASSGAGGRGGAVGGAYAPLPDAASARALYEDADARLMVDPYNAKALRDRALASQAMGNYTAALADAELIVWRNPRDAGAKQLTDDLESQIATPPTAPPTGATQPEPATEPDPAEEMAQESADAPVELVPEMPAEEPAPSALELAMARADAAIAAGDLFLALAALDDALEQEPGYAKAIEKQGWVYARQERFDDAVGTLMTLENRSPGARDVLGYALLRIRRYEQAASELTAVIDADGETANRLLYRGAAFTSLRDPAAEADLTRALELGGDDWPSATYAQNLLDRARANR